MVQVFRMVEANRDNTGNYKPNHLKQAIHYLVWPRYKEIMQAKYNFFIKNKI